jgi:RNA polymerase sigma factor (sigma-70 family)
MTAAQVVNDEATVKKLVHENRKLVFLIANRYRGKFWELQEDIEGAGMLGLVKAAQRYDTSKGYKFSSLAVTWIRGEILRFIRERGGKPKTSRTEGDLYMKHHRLSDVQAAEAAGISLARWKEIKQSNSVSLVTYDAQVHDSGWDGAEIEEEADLSKLDAARAAIARWVSEFDDADLATLEKICAGKGKRVELEGIKERLQSLVVN